MEKIRKEIHLPSTVVKALARVAAMVGKTPKKYMEDLIVDKTKSRIDEIKKQSIE